MGVRPLGNTFISPTFQAVSLNLLETRFNEALGAYGIVTVIDPTLSLID